MSTYPLVDKEIINKARIAYAYDPYQDHPDFPTVHQYVADLFRGCFRGAENYFTDKEKEIKDLVKILFDPANWDADKKHPRMLGYEENLCKIQCYCGKMRRQVIGAPVGLDEKIGAKKREKEYFNCGYSMKVMAWAAVHFYLTDIIWEKKYICSIIPGGYNPPSVREGWNEYIRNMNDVPAHVKDIFMVNEDNLCIYRDGETVDVISDKPAEKIPNVPQDDKPVEQKYADPVNTFKINPKQQPEVVATVPVQEDKKPEVVAIVPVQEDKKAKEKPAEEKKPEEKPVETPKPVEQKKPEEKPTEQKKPEEKGNKEYFEGLKKERISFEFNPKPKTQAETVVGRKIEDQEQFGPYRYSANNEEWEKKYPYLQRITNMFRSLKWDVFYYSFGNSALFGVQLIKTGGNVVDKAYTIDPGIVYGDTYRIIPVERPDENLFSQVFIAPNNKEMMKKILENGLSSDDIFKIRKGLPASIVNANVLQRVDLSGFNGHIGYLDWKGTITRISEILKSMPACRFRITDYKEKDKFRLVCDPYVTCVIRSMIMESGMHAEQVRHGLVVDVDPKYDLGYTVYNLDRTPIMFDAYAAMRADSKKESAAAAD